MKKLAFTFISTILISGVSIGQIVLPKEFSCQFGENVISESYFENGNYKLSSHPWGREGLYGADLISFLEENSKIKYYIKKLKTAFFWATGKYNGKYYYTLIVDSSFEFTLRSKINDKQFSEYSSFLLEQIRNNIKQKKDNYYVDYKGNSCSGVK